MTVTCMSAGWGLGACCHDMRVLTCLRVVMSSAAACPASVAVVVEGQVT
jgi:hypothetical protein